MLKVLHIDSSILEENSVTRLLSSAIVRLLQDKYPDSHIVYRDVVADEISHLTGPIAAGFRPLAVSEINEQVAAQHRLSSQLVAEFLESDVIVIGAPMYNFSVASQLKSWLDRLAQAGKTFRYTDKGPVGLSGGRSVIIASARGGFYTGVAFADMDFQERYLQAFFAFLGIKDVHFIRAEGASKGDEIRTKEINSALNAIEQVVATVAV